jgi:heme-degrading monooxygenase HmoA
MFAVIFEVMPHKSEHEVYLSIAAALRPELLKIEGFLENERFCQEGDPSRLLSLSLWRDEKALVRWRTQELHHRSQVRGRDGVLENYRLRVGDIAAQLNEDSLTLSPEAHRDFTEVGPAKFVTLSVGLGVADLKVPETSQTPATAEAPLRFVSLNDPQRQLLLLAWPEEASAMTWLREREPSATVRHYGINILRTYGMLDRREAPVFHNAPGVSSALLTEGVALKLAERTEHIEKR